MVICMSLGVFVFHLLNVSGRLCISFVTCLWMSLYVFVFHLLHVSGCRCMSSYFMCYMSLGVFVCFCISFVTCLWMFLYVLFTFVCHLQPFMFVFTFVYHLQPFWRKDAKITQQRLSKNYKVPDLRREDWNTTKLQIFAEKIWTSQIRSSTS